ncbi:MAG: adenylate/guanylate cyclase domain-containing protein [Saprospiraceae bacterium]
MSTPTPRNHRTGFNRSSRFRTRAFWLLVKVALFWYAIGFVKTVYDYYLLKNNNGEVFDFANWLAGMGLAITLGLLFLGPLIIYVLYRFLRAAPYWKVLLYLLIGYAVIAVGMELITLPVIYGLDHQVGIFSQAAFLYALHYLQTPNFLAVFLFWLLVLLLTVVVILVNEKYGPGMFGKLLMGQYYRPKKEDRIFMFLDMKSSTAIAEDIGEEAYFNLLKDCFADMTGPILDNEGEIYQYVGDEVIVCWPLETGLKSGRCVQTFLDIRQKLRQMEAYYLEKYGVLPAFKAGFHAGQVMAGEIGVIKRDITYSGDVLNTTSRIQSKCNELGVDHLISGSLWQQLRPHFSIEGERVSVEVALRGRNEKVDLYRVVES